MTLAQGSAVVALVSAVVAVVITIVGVFERRHAFRTQAEQWKEEFKAKADQWNEQFRAERRSQEVLLKKDFLLQQYGYRLSAYGDVLKTLGAVPDVMLDSGPEKYKALRANERMLRLTAETLRDQLYGKPGLLMTMRTRNSLHSAWQECLRFLQGDGDEQSGDRLVVAFFYARRYLRADLELMDDRTPETQESLVKKLDESSQPAGVKHPPVL